jgi:hypothetical protein
MTNKKKRGRNGFSTDLTAEDDSFILADLDNVHNDQDLSLVDLSNSMDNEEVINILLASSDLDYKDEFEHNNFSEDFVTDNKDRANELLGNNPFLIKPIEHDLLTEPYAYIAPDSKKIIELNEIERKKNPMNGILDDVPLDQDDTTGYSQQLIDLLLGGIDISEKTGLELTDPRFEQIITLVEAGRYAEAAGLSEAILLAGIFDLRLICYYLYGYWLDKGLASLADVTYCLNNVMLKNANTIRQSSTLNNILEKSLYWIFRQLSRTLQREAQKNTLVWKQWQTNITDNELDNILNAGESFRTIIKEQDYDNREALFGLWGGIEDSLLSLHNSDEIELSEVVGASVNESAYDEGSFRNIKNDLTNHDYYQEINNKQKEIQSSLAAVRLEQELFRKQLSSNEN